MTFTGMLRSIGKNNVVVESDDKTITTISTAKSTKYIGVSGGSDTDRRFSAWRSRAYRRKPSQQRLPCLDDDDGQGRHNGRARGRVAGDERHVAPLIEQLDSSSPGNNPAGSSSGSEHASSLAPMRPQFGQHYG